MKLTNISNKVIGVGGVYVRPDEAIDITKDVAELPAIRAYVRIGLVKLVDDEAEKREMEKKIRAEMEAKAKAEKEAKEKAEAEAKAAVAKAEAEAKAKAEAEARAKAAAKAAADKKTESK